MNPFIAFIIGLLVGWVIEWIIDWIYWRRKTSIAQSEGLESSRKRVAELEQEIASYKNQIAYLQVETSRSAAVPVRKAVDIPVMQQTQAHDHLEEIKGITPEMARQLNEAGIYTFADLGALRPQKLKEILGGQLPQTSSEVDIIKQARLTSGMIQKVDDLEVILGIGPVIARTLNYAGIFTFAELGALSAKDLREIVGERIERLADEEQILSQARQLAKDQSQGG